MKVRQFIPLPYDESEDYLFNSLNRSSAIATLNSNRGDSPLPMVDQIFDKIHELIESQSDRDITGNSGKGQSTGNNAKEEIYQPFSIILKHLILSGIDGFETGTSELVETIKRMTLIQQETQNNNTNNGSLLRFSSHLLIFYRAASFNFKVILIDFSILNKFKFNFK
jgi:hypothetical protein